MSNEEAQDPPKPKVFGAYVLVKALGRGAMGDVHLARPIDPDRGIPTPIVVKRLHGELATRKGFVARFRHEAAIAVAVESAHVAKVYDVGSVGETLYICMDYVPGWPLSRVLDAILKSGHHASIASVVDLIAGGLEGLHALHTAVEPKSGKPLEIVHRDLSPKNLMVGEDGAMRLIDLGLGKSKAQDWRTRTGVVMGSVGYMPPEQALGERVDARADVYAMGAVAFEMLALRNYIRRGPLPKMMEASTTPTFVRPSEFRPDVPRGLDHVIEKALKPNKDERYETAKDFLMDLRRVVPPSHAQGGMSVLLSDLFGSTRQDRDDEVRALMLLPVDGDEFESRPTRVYVMRDGIIPPDLQTTEHRAHPSRPESVAVVGVTTVGEGTATQVTAYDPVPEAASPTVPTALMQSGPMVQARMRAPSFAGDTTPPPTNYFGSERPARGVSIGVLIASVILASIVGGGVATFVVSIANEPPNNPVQVLKKAPPPVANVEPRPSAVANEVLVATPTPIPPSPVPTKKVPPRKRNVAAKRTPPEAEPPPAAPPETLAAIDAKLIALAERLQKKRADAPQETQSAIRKIQRDITFARNTTNLDRKRAAFLDLDRRARALD